MMKSEAVSLPPQTTAEPPLTEQWLRENIWPRFSRVLSSSSGIYLANHSLGRPLDQTAIDVQEGLDLWYSRLDGAWEDDGWPAEIERFRSNISQLIGPPSSRNVIPKTSAGQGLRAVLNSFDRPPTVVATRGEFDSIDLILRAYVQKDRAQVRWIEARDGHSGLKEFTFENVLAGLDGSDLLVLSYVFFATGQIMPCLSEIIRQAHQRGILVLVDAYHAAGVIPFSFQELQADFMVGGSYKYARGGPGACWLAVSDQCLEERRTLDTGWFAKKDPFKYARPEAPEFGEAWLESTPPVLTMYQARAGLELLLELGVGRLRDYNLKQQAILREAFEGQGVAYARTDPADYGAYTTITHPKAPEIAERLAQNHVTTDARGATIRFGPDILNSEEDLREAARITARIIAS
jgi:kynureninase